MKLIESKTLASAAASIEFTSIPQDGTDLVLLVSARSSVNNSVGDSAFRLLPNASSANGTSRILGGSGSGTYSATDSFLYARLSPNDSTSDTFGNTSFYIPNYTVSTNKSISVDTVSENNATFARQEIIAGLWSNTAAITSLTITAYLGNFVVGSTASLYKITKGSDGIVTTS
jgi:hypothetical protein